MKSRLYYAAIEGDSTYLQAKSMMVRNQVTHDMNTVLHLSSQLGHTMCVRAILQMHPILLTKQNLAGETALHLAAREGRTDVVKVLIDEAKKLQPDHDHDGVLSAKETMIRMPNLLRDSALHEATRFNRVDVVKVLVEEDKEDSHYRNLNDDTPLYIAAYKGYFEVVKVICETCTSPAYGGSDGRNVLHAAIINGTNFELTEYIAYRTPSLVNEIDKNGWTALHYAAYFGNYPDVNLILVDFDKSSAYVADEVGKRTALHIAAAKGEILVIEELTKCCPDCLTMVDGKGRNVLHIAVNTGNKKMIEYLLKSPIIGLLLNQKDGEGNTPFHLVAESGCFAPQMLKHDMIDPDVLNDKKLTPLDLIHSGIQEMSDQRQAHITLRDYKTNITSDLRNAIRGEVQLKPEEDEKEIEALRRVGDTHMIVAALISTITFTAGFTMPGGVDGNEGSSQGKAILSTKTAFQAFIVSDTIALVLSTVSLVIYYTASLYKSRQLLRRLLLAPMIFNILAIMAMMIAFISGIYVVLPHSSSLAISLLLIGSSFFIILFIVLGIYVHRVQHIHI